MTILGSNSHEAAARDAKAAKLAAGVLAAVPDLTEDDVDDLLGSRARRHLAELSACVRPASEQTWGLVGGKLRQYLSEDA